MLGNYNMSPFVFMRNFYLMAVLGPNLFDYEATADVV